jgi:hypothetical protein
MYFGGKAGGDFPTLRSIFVPSSSRLDRIK